jgi:S-phase kinase-associated protein 1
MSLSLDTTEQVQTKSITLITTDKDKSTHPFSLFKMSELISTALETDQEEHELELNISSQHLEWILEFLIHYKESEPVIIEKPLRSKDLKDAIPLWDYEYITQIHFLGNKALYDFTNACNYMAVKPLVELCCAKIAHMVKNTPLDELENKLKA